MKMRPEAEQRLRAGFQRRVDKQRDRYAPQLAHARELGTWFGCGEVAGVFDMDAGYGWRFAARAYLPLAAVLFLIIGAAEQVPGALPGLAAFPFLWGIWFGVCIRRARRRRVWLYAYTGGFLLLGDRPGEAVPVSWGQVTGVSPLWTEVYQPGSEDYKTVLGGYRLRTADGRTHEISKSFKNVEDPYREMGQLFRTLAPGTIGTTMPTFPTVDQIIAAYAMKPGS